MKKLIAALLISTPLVSIADVVVLDDHIVDGSQCVGFDCVNGESFGFDTLRLKENNIRINVEDTSSSASFPGNDWRLVFNDSANGGSNYFAVEDSTAGKTAFKVEAAAPSNTLVVESTGDVGIGTANPVVKLHTVDGDSPTLRLEQNGSSGFTPQTWDIAGNETNFFIRDATNGSKLPFKIRPNAPTGSIDITANGVKIPTISGSALIQDTNATKAGRTLLTLSNNGNPEIHLNNTSRDIDFKISGGDNLVIKKSESGVDTAIVNISNSGDITIQGDVYVTVTAADLSTRKISLMDLIETVEGIEGVTPLVGH